MQDKCVLFYNTFCEAIFLRYMQKSKAEPVTDCPSESQNDNIECVSLWLRDTNVHRGPSGFLELILLKLYELSYFLDS